MASLRPAFLRLSYRRKQRQRVLCLNLDLGRESRNARFQREVKTLLTNESIYGQLWPGEIYRTENGRLLRISQATAGPRRSGRNSLVSAPLPPPPPLAKSDDNSSTTTNSYSSGLMTWEEHLRFLGPPSPVTPPPEAAVSAETVVALLEEHFAALPMPAQPVLPPSRLRADPVGDYTHCCDCERDEVWYDHCECTSCHTHSIVGQFSPRVIKLA